MQLNLVAHFEKTGIGKMSFYKERKKIGCFRSRPFWQGQKDSFSSLDARRSGRLYRAKGHGIHCRPILVLLQEANKKIGCLCNRPFWQGQKDSFSSLDARRSGRLYRAKGHGIHCRPILVLLQEANKKNRLLLQPTFLADPHFRNPNILLKRKNGYFSLDYRKQ